MNPIVRARALRQNSTWAERRLWRLLRSRKLAGYKFRRQYPEGPYFLDFYCLEARLAVELDGSGHGYPDQQALDQERDRFLAARGILVRRIWNHELARAESRERVISNLWSALQERDPHPGNLPLAPHRRAPDKSLPDAPHPGPLPSDGRGNGLETPGDLSSH